MRHRKKIIYIVVIVVLFIISKGLFDTVIEEKETRIQEYKTQVVELKKEVSKWKEVSEKYSKQENITITEKDGNKVTQINRNVNKDTESSEKEVIKESQTKEVIKESQTKETRSKITNPKKLGVGAGYTSDLEYYGIINYNFIGPFSVGATFSESKIGGHVMFSF